jgi:hypothetical protein
MDPWRFDPTAASVAVNRVIRAGPHALALLLEWVHEADDSEEAIGAVIATRIAVAPVPVFGRSASFLSGAPPLPHHPFVMSNDVPFLPEDALEAGGAMIAPAEFVEMCFRQGVLRQSLLVAANPIPAVLDLLASDVWDALIAPERKARSSRMVRFQAVRATGRTELLPTFEPSITEDEQFEHWWRFCLARN